MPLRLHGRNALTGNDIVAKKVEQNHINSQQVNY